MKRQRYLELYLRVLVVCSLFYILEHCLLHSQHGNESNFICFGIPALCSAALMLSCYRFMIIEKGISKITLTHETLSIDPKQKIPIVIPWTKFEGYSTSLRLLYLRFNSKSKTIGSHLAIPLADITPDALDFIKTRLNSLAPLDKIYDKKQYPSRLWGSIAHLSALSMYFTGIGFIAGPLVMWLWTRKSDAYVSGEAREALNFNLSILIYYIVTALLCLPYVLVPKGAHTVAHGFADGYLVLGVCAFILMLLSSFVLMLIFGFQLVCILVAGGTTGFGKPFRYPLNLRLVREGR